MNIITRTDGLNKLTVVTLIGSLDVSGASIIESDMRNAVNRGGDIAIDLSGVTFLSSQGVRILVITSKAVVEKNSKFYLVGPNPQIRKVLSIMGVDKLINVYESLDEIGMPTK